MYKYKSLPSILAKPDQMLIIFESINSKNKFHKNSSTLFISTDTLIAQIIKPIA